MQTTRYANTHRRFEAAIARAKHEQIAVVGFRGDRAIVTASGGQHTYLTDGVACTCTAGQKGDPICKHRAAWYLFHEAIEPHVAA